MICVQLNGGLGNQMFQYAFGRAMAFKLQTDLLFDTSPLLNNKTVFTNRSLELGIFKIKIQEASITDIKRLKTIFYRIVNTLAFKAGFQGIQTSKYFIEKNFSYNESIDKIGKDCYLNGYWQSYKYFQNIESIIREEFKFPPILEMGNKDTIVKIENGNSISLHIRRTDFVNNKNHDIHGTCSIKYYQEAAENIANRVSDPVFFIFSDDIEWVRTNLNLNYPCEFVSGNNSDKSYIDMQLMSLCKHNIIANSSFSWWGAWLNANPNKIVIAPLQWFADETMNAQTYDLIPSNWIKI